MSLTLEMLNYARIIAYRIKKCQHWIIRNYSTASNTNQEIIKSSKFVEQSTNRNLNDKTLVFDNFTRLRPFFIFLGLHSIPIIIFGYYIKKFEAERKRKYSVSLDGVDDVIDHIWNVIKGSTCFLKSNGDRTFYIKPKVGYQSDLIQSESLSSVLDSLGLCIYFGIFF